MAEVLPEQITSPKGKEKEKQKARSLPEIADLPAVEPLLKTIIDTTAKEQTSRLALFFNAQAPQAKGSGGVTTASYTELPSMVVQPLQNPHVFCTITGPEDENEQYLGDIASCRSVSSYPMVPHTNPPIRQGEPVCDRYYLRIFENRAIIVVADGCNWGMRPKDAATKATNAFVEYLQERQVDVKDMKEMGHLTLRAFSVAHNAILKGKSDIWECGTTTMLGGLLARMPDSSDGRRKWSFLCGSVGDCKAYHYSASHDAITDITELNRFMSNSLDAKDPGGRLGPYVGKEGHPDLRNLSLFHLIARDDDIVMIVSDGVHDNLDAMQLGKKPSEVAPVDPSLDWTTIGALENERIRTKYRNTVLKKIFHACNFEPRVIVNTLMEHVMNITKASREFMETEPNKKQPMDYVLYPGKMDHATAACLKISDFVTLIQTVNNESA